MLSVDMGTVKRDREWIPCWSCRGPIVDPFPCHKGCLSMRVIVDFILSRTDMAQLQAEACDAALSGIGLVGMPLYGNICSIEESIGNARYWRKVHHGLS